MNVYDQAHSLAAAVKASEEFKQYETTQINESLSFLYKDQEEKLAKRR